MPTTELVILTLQAPDVNSVIGDPNHAASKALKQVCSTLINDGKALSVYFGSVLEDTSKLRLIINWESLAAHEKFKASEGYKAFQAKVKGLEPKGPPSMTHVEFQPAGAFEKVLSAPTTEFVIFYFDGDVPADYGEGIAKVQDVADFPAHAIAWGPTHETVEHEGVKGKAATVAIGWASHDAHMQFRSTPLMAELRPHLRNSSKSVAMQHIQAMKFVE